ncbi:MAG: hypothetical protein DWQ37_23700 [Planctomycetota bacterium]|nr:MAG: hypothetical protein DWQ37_23700 [Planctomycetota bacterium]
MAYYRLRTEFTGIKIGSQHYESGQRIEPGQVFQSKQNWAELAPTRFESVTDEDAIKILGEQAVSAADCGSTVMVRAGMAVGEIRALLEGHAETDTVTVELAKGGLKTSTTVAELRGYLKGHSDTAVLNLVDNTAGASEDEGEERPPQDTPEEQAALDDLLSSVGDDPRGVNVTEQFPDAKGNGLIVFRKGSWYSVYEDDGSTEPVNGKALKQVEVEDFVARFIAA